MLPSEKLKTMHELVKQRLLRRNMFNNSLQWQSNITNLNMESILKPLPCSNAIICTQSENIPEESFKSFAKEFYKMDINTKDSKKGLETKPATSLVASDNMNVAENQLNSIETIQAYKNNTGKRVPRKCRVNTRKLSSTVDAGEVLQNLYFNSKIGKNKKCILEEPDYEDVDLTVTKRPPAKKIKPNKTTKANKIDDIDEDDFIKNLPQKKTRPSLNLEFKTAKEELQVQESKNDGGKSINCKPGIVETPKEEVSNPSSSNTSNNVNKRKVGNKRNASGKFISPMLSNNSDSAAQASSSKSQEWLDAAMSTNSDLKLIEPRMVELIRSEIMDRGPSIQWADIAGLEFAKQAVQEAVVWPMLRPDIFKGLRRPPKGILFFGPPGTGKTLIGKCVASQSKSTFFTISASSLTSKWVGEGEKMVRALFTVARSCQPAVIFIDEVDSLLSQRSDGEHESSRRIKTEFLVQLDGATTDEEERLLVIGATNRPQELDEAARRRFTKRLYIPLPEKEARLQLVNRLMANEKHSLLEGEMIKISELSNGFSGADMRNLCAEACLGPIRSIDISQMASIEAAEVPAVQMKDFVKSFTRVRPSVCQKDLEQYVQWDTKYGSGI